MTLIRRLLMSGGPSGGFTPDVPHTVKAYGTAYETWADQEVGPLLLAATEFDTDSYHFTSHSNLTGTVATTTSSAAIVGTSTLFTTELSVNQVFSVSTDVFAVAVITDNTHLTAWQIASGNLSGQTATRRNEYLAVPAGLGGYYRMTGGTFVNQTPVQDAPMAIHRIPAASQTSENIIGAQFTPTIDQPGNVGGVGHVHGAAILTDGDLIRINLYIDNGSGGAKTFYVGGAPSLAGTWQRGLASWLHMERVP